MPEDLMIPAGYYKVRKRFRQEEVTRKKRDIPWQKRVLDLDNNQLFGRTAFAWLRFIGYYLFLYFLIFLLMSMWFIIFNYALIPKDRPRWLKGAPGLSAVPGNTTTISWYTHLEKHIHPIADTIEAALEKLNDNAEKFFHECNPDSLWGYGTAKTPCFFVKMNHVYGFKPQTYDDINDLPASAPDELNDVLGKYGGKSRIWLSCKVSKGPSPTMIYIPGPYYDVSSNMKGVTRMVAIQLKDMPENKEVQITCKVWAKNIAVSEKISGKGHIKISLRMRVDKQAKPKLKPKTRRVTIRRRVLRPSTTATTEQQPKVSPTSQTVTAASPRSKTVRVTAKVEDDTETADEADEADVEDVEAEKETEKPNKNKAANTPKAKKVAHSPKKETVTESAKEREAAEPSNEEKDSVSEDEEEDEEDEAETTVRYTRKPKQMKMRESPKKQTVTETPKNKKVIELRNKEEDADIQDEDDEDESETETTARTTRNPKKIKVPVTSSPKQRKIIDSPKHSTVTESSKKATVTESPKQNPLKGRHSPRNRKVKTINESRVPSTRKPRTPKVTSTKIKKVTAKDTPKQTEQTPKATTGNQKDEVVNPPIEEYIPETTEFDPYFANI
ncbi:titin [Drosophila madeirensis]|uniref:Titin n=1 Tax=Drosophila madeirensis TaxID=30013 RepID=A0AAU9EXQ8_DROMD